MLLQVPRVANGNNPLDLSDPLNRGLFFCARYGNNGPSTLKSWRNLVRKKEFPTVYGTSLKKCRGGWLNSGFRNTADAGSYLHYAATVNDYTTRLTGTVIYTPEALGGDYRILNENNAGGTYPFLLRTSGTKLEIFSVYGPAGLAGATTLTVGRTYLLGFTIGAAGTLIYVNGVLDATGTYSGATMSNSVALTIGSDLGAGGACGIIEEVRLYNREFSASEMRRLYEAAIKGYQRQTNWLTFPKYVTGPVLNNYSLTAAQGSFTLTGQSANLNYGRKVAASQGGFTLTGQAASLVSARKITSDFGSFTFTGQAAGMNRGFTMAADQGSYTLTGQAAGLLATRTIVAAQGSYSLTGQTAGLLAARKITASQGSYTLTGQAANLRKSTVITASQGSFTLNGQAVSLNRGYAMVAGSGYYALNGQDAGLTRTYIAACDYGSFVLNGQDVALAYASWEVAGGGDPPASRRKRKLTLLV